MDCHHARAKRRAREAGDLQLACEHVGAAGEGVVGSGNDQRAGARLVEGEGAARDLSHEFERLRPAGRGAESRGTSLNGRRSRHAQAIAVAGGLAQGGVTKSQAADLDRVARVCAELLDVDGGGVKYRDVEPECGGVAKNGRAVQPARVGAQIKDTAIEAHQTRRGVVVTAKAVGVLHDQGTVVQIHAAGERVVAGHDAASRLRGKGQVATALFHQLGRACPIQDHARVARRLRAKQRENGGAGRQVGDHALGTGQASNAHG